MDVDNWGSKGNQTAIALDLSNKKIALVTPDKLAQASELILAPGGTDYSVAQARVSTGNFNLALSNFGADDLLYVDDLGRQPPENFAQTMQLIFNIQRSDSTQNNNTTFFFDPIDGSLGGQILIVGQNFATIEEWTRELSGSQAPFVFGSS